MKPSGWIPGLDSWVWVGDTDQPKDVPPWPPSDIASVSLGVIGQHAMVNYEHGLRDGYASAIDEMQRLLEELRRQQ